MKILCYRKWDHQNLRIHLSVIGMQHADQNAKKIPQSRVSYLTVNKKGGIKFTNPWCKIFKKNNIRILKNNNSLTPSNNCTVYPY